MKRALIIGIDEHPTAPLSAAARDANEIASVLETNGDGSPNFEVKLITAPPNKATRASVREAIDALFKDPCDVALLYIAAHGMLVNTGGYIVTTDASRYDEGVSMDDILVMANNSPAKNCIVILDCCHAGAFAAPALNPSGAQLREGLTVLAGCRKDGAAMENGRTGLFTALLLDALKGGAADVAGHITSSGVYAYVDQALGAWSQRPIFCANVSQFISLRDITPRVPLAVLRKLPQYFPEPQRDYPLDPAHEDTTDAPDPVKVAIFKDLQKMERVGLIVPKDEDFMYFAAMNSKACHLTALGWQYWRLAKEKRI